MDAHEMTLNSINDIFCTCILHKLYLCLFLRCIMFVDMWMLNSLGIPRRKLNYGEGSVSYAIEFELLYFIFGKNCCADIH